MARVIKGGGNAGGQKPPRPPTRVLVDPGARRVIGRDVFQAKQDAEHILKRAEQERQLLVQEGKKRAAQAREEAMARGASEAFAAAAAEALTAFRKRAERYAEASDDVRALAVEVAKKVLGTDPDLGPAQVDKILQRGMAQLRARRRLRLQVSEMRLGELASERPNLMKALQSEPDLVIEGADDVGAGFARVVTEIGGALCAEETALDALSMAVNVREQPRDPRTGRASTGNTAVGAGPAGLDSLRRSSNASLPEAAVEELDDPSDAAATLAANNGRSAMDDETMNIGPRGAPRGLTKRPVIPRTEEIEEIAAVEEDSDATEARRPTATPAAAKPARPATRVVALEPEDSDATLRHAPVLDAARGKGGEGDADLDLFTDDAPRKRR